MNYQLIISETGCNNLKEEASLFNIIKETFKELSDIKDYIVDRYGRMPKGKNKIYHDGKNGQAEEVGFLHSFWNQDISHNSKKWYQTDWIEVCEVNTRPVLIQ